MAVAGSEIKLSYFNSLYLIYFPAATKQHGFVAHQYEFVRKLTPSSKSAAGRTQS